MKFCMNCGAQMEDSAEICPSCNAKQTTTADTADPTVPANAAEATKSAEVAEAAKSSSQTNMKFCMHCGSQMEDNAEVCPSCGANQTNSAEAADPTVPAEAANPSSKTKPVLIAAAAVVVLIILLILKALFGASYIDPVDNLCKCMETGKGKYLYKCVPAFLIEDEYDDMKKSEIIDELDESAEDMLESLEKTFGDDIKVKYKVKKKEKIDSDDIDELEDDLKDEYDKRIKISKGYELKVKLTIKGDDRDSSNTQTLKVYKISGKWYFLDNIPGL